MKDTPMAKQLQSRAFNLVICLLMLFVIGRAQQKTKEFTIDDIYVSGKFTSAGIRGFTWIEHGKAYSYLLADTAKKQSDIWKYEVASGKRAKIVDGGELLMKKGDQPLAVQNY